MYGATTETGKRDERLVVLLPRALGDVVACLPALGLVRRAGFDPCILGPGRMADLLSSTPFAVQAEARGRELWRQYRDSGARFGLNMRSSFRSALDMRRAGLKVVGFRSQSRSLLLWRALRRPRGTLKLDEYYRLAQFGISVFRGGGLPDQWDRPSFPRIEPAAHHTQQARRLLRQAGVQTPYVVCCTTAAARYRPGWKIWTGFPELVERIKAGGRTVVTCPGPGEEAQCRELAPAGTMLAGVGLGPYSAILAGAACVVSNDTGAMHLAAAVGVPTLGVFGDTSPIRHAPFGRRAGAVGELGRWPTVDEVFDELVQRAGLEQRLARPGGQ